MKKKLFFYCIIITISIINTLLLGTNPFDSQNAPNHSPLVFKDTSSPVFINIFTYLNGLIDDVKTPLSTIDAIDRSEENANNRDVLTQFSDCVKNAYIIDACLYYIDRGAVQEAKKNDHVKLFNLIKEKSTNLKNSLYEKIFLGNNGIYKTLLNSNTIISKKISNDNRLAAISYAQIGVLPELKIIVDELINNFKKNNADLLLNQQNELKTLEEKFNQDKNAIELNRKNLTDSKLTYSTNQNNELQDLTQKLNTFTSQFNTTGSTISELKTQISQLKKGISEKKNSLKDYDNLLVINAKKNILQNTKELFEELKPLANKYYDAYLKWENDTKSKGFFAQLSSLVKEKPQEIKKKATDFSQKVKTALDKFKESMKENNFPVAEIKGGFLLLQGIADGQEMLSQEKFDQIVNNIDADLKQYEKLIDDQAFYQAKEFIDSQESELNSLSSSLRSKEESLTEIKSKIDRLNENITELNKTIETQNASLKKTISSYEQKIKDLENKLEEDKKNVEKKYTDILNQSKEKQENVYNDIDYSNVVKSYLAKLKELPYFGLKKEIDYYELLIALFNLVAPIHYEISFEELNKKNKADTLLQKAIALKQTTVERFSTLYAQFKKGVTINPANKTEDVYIANEHIYYAFPSNLKKIIKVKLKSLEQNINNIHDSLVALIIAPIKSEDPIASISYLQLLYMLYAKPTYTVYEKLNASIQNITEIPSNVSIENQFDLFIQTIDEQTKNIVDQNQINKINDDQSIKTAYAFFNKVADVLKREAEAVLIPTNNSKIDSEYFDFINKINNLTQLITIIEQSQLIWYQNSEDLQKLFDPVKKAILDKKNSFLNDILNQTAHMQSKKTATTSKDLELKNNKLTGALLEEINRTYQLLEKITQITLVTTPQERTALFKSNHATQWITKFENLVKSVVQDQEKLHQAETLYQQTVLFLYEKIKNTAEKANVIKKQELPQSKKPLD